MSVNALDQLVELSHFYGADNEFVIAGGGNTSVKVEDRLFVKGSGTTLATISADGFVEMHRKPLVELADRNLGTDRDQREAQFKQAVMAARVYPEKNQRPSVEVVLHELMPRKFVVHTHATYVNMVTCCKSGQKIAADIFGDQIIWIGDVDPGHELAQTLRDALKSYKQKTGRDCPRAILMKNHGLVIAGNTPDEVKKDTDWVIGTLRQRIANPLGENVFGPVTSLPADKAKKLINIVGPALRGLLCTEDDLKVVTFDDSPAVMSLVGGANGAAVAAGGPLTPDQIVYCKAFPLWIDLGDNDDPKAVLAALKDAVKAHQEKTRFLPHVVLVKGLGMFAAGDDIAAASTVRLVFTDAIKAMAGATRLGGIEYLSQSLREFIEHWEVESYRRKIAKGDGRKGRSAGKIAIVTGAAQGFGLEIAQDFAAKGGHVVLTDMNAEGARKAAAEIESRLGAGRALGLAINVTDGASVEEAVHQVVRAFGGFDVLISNAGVLKAGSVKTQPEKDFDFTTAVNYKGYFLCVQKVAPVLSIQHQCKEGYWSDIIQINSKSGLQGSNKNGAYAGSKFGGIGLTQSFAMELVEDCIKVNSICPGNFFDGPLWSDPKTGLFVQYLNTGKVPGAKTIADVKRFYEAKVPMNRGCTTPDVMNAVYYLMDQKYETGQAIPVTGGQVMLH